MDLSSADLELVNAFHDGELDHDAAAALEERLETEPALRTALEDISEISRALGALRPAVIADFEKSAPRSAASGGLTIAKIGIAASFVTVFLAGASLLFPDKTETSLSPFDWHRLFVAQSYLPGDILNVTSGAHWIANAPDLSAARLTLVDAAGTVGKDFYLHYSGVNDCRLTFGIHADHPAVPPKQPNVLVRNWRSGEVHYSLFAVGMDRDRFEAIAAMLVRQAETGSPGDNSLMAVRETTRTAAPCA